MSTPEHSSTDEMPAQSRHWTDGGTGITNFQPKDVNAYEKAIAAWKGPQQLVIHRQPMLGSWFKGDFSLHILNREPDNNLSEFWELVRSFK